VPQCQMDMSDREPCDGGNEVDLINESPKTLGGCNF
jgi:hypothetical protein